jgi:hypothetical protein
MKTMKLTHKGLIIILSFVLAIMVSACSSSSLGSLFSTKATPTASGQAEMPGLAGTWENPDTSDEFVIIWQNNQYEVVSAAWKGITYKITSQSWSGSSLTWSYYDTDMDLTVTFTTTSINGDNLYTKWTYSDGGYGTETLERVK